MYGEQGSCSIVVAGIVGHTRPKPLQQSSISRSFRNFCASLRLVMFGPFFSTSCSSVNAIHTGELDAR